MLWFIRLGTFIERADNTARILDVKYQVIQEDEDSVREFTAGTRYCAPSARMNHIKRCIRGFITPIGRRAA